MPDRVVATLRNSIESFRSKRKDKQAVDRAVIKRQKSLVALERMQKLKWPGLFGTRVIGAPNDTLWLVKADEMIRVGGNEVLSIIERFPISANDCQFASCDAQGRDWLSHRLKDDRGTKLIRFATSAER